MVARKAIRPVLFLHVGWAREYQGAADDTPLGKFGYFREHDDAGEAANFKDYGGFCYGYAPCSAINLPRLGAPSGADAVDGVTVVWTATDPAGSGRYIVGWYTDATVYAVQRHLRPDKVRPGIVARAASGGCHLVAVDDRSFQVPARVRGWPGVASAFFASQTLSSADLGRVLSYVGGKPSNGFGDAKTVPDTTTSGWPTQDPELRAKVESAAIKAAVAHYRRLGWQVRSVEAENLGWDLEVSLGGRKLLVEVKGRGGTGSVEITPNEYRAMLDRAHWVSYRLAVVLEALSAAPRLSIFAYVPQAKAWKAPDGTTLTLKPITGAIASFETSGPED